MIISLDPSEKDTILGQTYDRLLPLLSPLDRSLIIPFKQMVKKNEVGVVAKVAKMGKMEISALGNQK